MVRNIIRLLAFVFSAVALLIWYVTNNHILIFTSAGFFLTFLGTFIKLNPVEKKDTIGGHNIEQNSGAFSNNNQTVNIHEQIEDKH